MNLATFNSLSKEEVEKHLAACCGSAKWQQLVLKHFPFSSTTKLLNCVNDIWYNQCNGDDWREAFLHHPEIGNIESLKEKYAATRQLASNEQSGVELASDEVLQQLADANKRYKEKNGFIFIVFATGKSAAEMLALLNTRLENSTNDEINIAMGEQQKITINRLKGIVEDLELTVSQLTTHILDTASGIPAAGIPLQLYCYKNEACVAITSGITNSDGRVAGLLPPGRILPVGRYLMRFETASYFSSQQIKTFYPFIEISFIITDNTHYHIPLLLSPFGYSTYRGS